MPTMGKRRRLLVLLDSVDDSGVKTASTSGESITTNTTITSAITMQEKISVDTATSRKAWYSTLASRIRQRRLRIPRKNINITPASVSPNSTGKEFTPLPRDVSASCDAEYFDDDSVTVSTGSIRTALDLANESTTPTSIHVPVTPLYKQQLTCCPSTPQPESRIFEDSTPRVTNHNNKLNFTTPINNPYRDSFPGIPKVTRPNRFIPLLPRFQRRRPIVPQQRWLIPSEHPFKILWDVLTVLISLVNAYITHTALRDRNLQDGTVWYQFSQLWFVMDIILNFFTEHKLSQDNGSIVLITSCQAVWARYLTTWFVIDVLSLVPGERLFLKPVMEQQKKRGWLKRNFFRTKAAIRVSRWLQRKHITLFSRVAKHSKRAGMGGASRLLRLIVKYVPKYLLFFRKMKGLVALRFLRQIHWCRKLWYNLILRRLLQPQEEQLQNDCNPDTESVQDEDFEEQEDDDNDDGEYEEDEDVFYDEIYSEPQWSASCPDDDQDIIAWEFMDDDDDNYYLDHPNQEEECGYPY